MENRLAFKHFTQVSSLPSGSCTSVEALSVHQFVRGSTQSFTGISGISHCQLRTTWGRSRERLNTAVSFPLEKPGPEPIPHGTELSRRNIFSIFSIVFSTISVFRILRGICKSNINSDSCPGSSLTVQACDLAAVSKTHRLTGWWCES